MDCGTGLGGQEPRIDRPFGLRLSPGRTTPAVRVHAEDALRGALRALGIRSPTRTLVLVGGASGLRAEHHERLRPVFDAMIAVLTQHGGAAVDGGTRSGVMRLLGEAHARAASTLPLVGVAAHGTVALPDLPPPRDDAASLDPNHTHVVLVPGDTWGAEAPWIARTATALAGGAPSVTVVIDGGAIAYDDVAHSIAADRPVLTLAGSGRTADALAAAARGAPADDRATALASSGLVTAAPVDDVAGFADAMSDVLDPPVRVG